ncbi:phosphocholine cytidylyltransferase family protein [Stappia sp. F7233]|uniref:Phosphocholine cytidylyltransferase family protein n=1 Tax=Stappia albiluteola TaxID=2758565 RepID=A0A839AI37_9HYPH|nr:phosphocholine cytidylyltransferase family protein [Stappia albiluteola]MBA5778736.1 phosphocholine cytidylyltransferase family protein [Stappia albiluteola]
MLDFTAIILAAGRGVRMGQRGEFSPKGLLRFGERSFVEESIANLRQRGVSRIRVVTGHLAEKYGEAAQGWAGNVRLCHNPDYVERGSLHSLMVGLDGLDGPCVVLESDLVYEPRALDVIDRDADRSTLVLSGPTGAGDEVYVWADPASRDGEFRLRDMSKQADRWPDRHYGELVGITALSAEAVSLVKQAAPSLIGERALADYEDGLVAAARRTEITCKRIDDLAWAEVDDERMFARAAEKVYPAIVAARKAD